MDRITGAALAAETLQILERGAYFSPDGREIEIGHLLHTCLSVNAARNTLLQAAPLGILAAAQTILMLTGGIDLSVTMITTGSAYVAANQSPQGAVIAILLGVVVGVAAGTANVTGVAIFRANPLIMTLAMSGILLGLFTSWTQTILQGSTRVGPFIKMVGGGSFFENRIPYSVVVWALVAVILIWLLRLTGWGRLIMQLATTRWPCGWPV
jgi:ribose transport system permease protein